MAYFKQSEEEAQEAPQRRFSRPVEDDDPYDDLGDELPDEYPDAMTYEEEMAYQRRDRYRMMAGLGDFLAVIAGMVVILMLIAVIISLINWVHADIVQSFTLWQTRIR